MCSRQELRTLIRVLLHHVEKVALWSAEIQYDDEMKVNKPAEYLTCSDHTKNYVRNNAKNARFNQVVRFHMAYMKYYVFALDPYAEIIVPLASSSLTLHIINSMPKAQSSQQIPFVHTSKTIVEFLQHTDAKLVHKFYMQYKRELQAIMEDMRLPYDIESMTKIRHEAFRKNLNMQRHGLPMRVPLVRTVSSSQRTRVIQMAQTATTTRSFQQPVTVRTMHQLQPMQPMRVATYEQHSYIGQQQQPQQQPHMVQMQSATTTMETVCADMQMQIPTVTSSIMAGPAMPTENYYQVYTTNGQTIDPSIPVYFISSTEPITVEVSSSDDVIGIAIDNSDQT